MKLCSFFPRVKPSSVHGWDVSQAKCPFKSSLPLGSGSVCACSYASHTNWMDRLKNHLCPCLKDVLKSDCCAMGDAEATTDQRAPD